MHVMIKTKQLHRFDTVINFLTTFNKAHPNFLFEQLYARVLVTLKTLVNFNKLKQFVDILSLNKNFFYFKHIFETMRAGDLKKTSNLIKEYFPSNYDYNQFNGLSPAKVNIRAKIRFYLL